MIRLALILLILKTLSAQYVLGKGVYIGINAARSFDIVFENEINDPDIKKSFSGNGNGFGVELLYKFDRRNMLSIEFGKRSKEISHESPLLASDSARVASATLKQKIEFNSFHIQYFKKFENNPLFFGAGAGGRFPVQKDGLDYIQNILEQSYGVGTIGLEFGTTNFSVATYASYAFPVSILKKNGSTESQLGELFLGVKLWVRLF